MLHDEPSHVWTCVGMGGVVWGEVVPPAMQKVELVHEMEPQLLV